MPNRERIEIVEVLDSEHVDTVEARDAEREHVALEDVLIGVLLTLAQRLDLNR
jgi:hypothetical protein